jgi:hypothetical protein
VKVDRCKSLARLCLPVNCLRLGKLPSASVVQHACKQDALHELVRELLCTGEQSARREWALSLDDECFGAAEVVSHFYLVASQPSALSSLTALTVATEKMALGSFAMMLLTFPSLRRLELNIEHDSDSDSDRDDDVMVCCSITAVFTSCNAPFPLFCLWLSVMLGSTMRWLLPALQTQSPESAKPVCVWLVVPLPTKHSAAVGSAHSPARKQRGGRDSAVGMEPGKLCCTHPFVCLNRYHCSQRCVSVCHRFCG